MYAWEQIQETINYIEGHLNEEVNIDQLAKEASLSPFYYQRLFCRLVKKPVAEYVRLRRLAKSVDALKDNNQRILDIALELGFTSHEHFTRSFKTAFGMTPDEYRKNPQALNYMTKPELTLNYTLVDEGVPLVTDGIVIEITRQKLDMPARFYGVDLELPVSFMSGLGTESGPDPLDGLWNNLHDFKKQSADYQYSKEELGVALAGSKGGTFRYFAGTIDIGKEKPDNFTEWSLPAGEYVVCTFEAENFPALVMDALYKAEQYVYNTWLPNHHLMTEPFCAERYPSHGDGTTSMSVWLKIENQ